MNFEFCMVYITTTDKAEADRIAEHIVAKRLAACANIIDQMESRYHWKNIIEKDNESILILKTKTALFQDIVTEVKKLHSYEVPCILAYPILEGNPAYLEWLRKEIL
ncbi:MAG: divalent-cation tolerance protein CutA [Leptospira sp.]|nr:divalent-cation tolerance protein CutA [Leptospira sp.]